MITQIFLSNVIHICVIVYNLCNRRSLTQVETFSETSYLLVNLTTSFELNPWP
jgi:hypothetical protein